MMTFPSSSDASYANGGFTTPTIPADITERLIKVMALCSTVGYDDFNEHGSYKFASVDAVYDAVRKHMASAGLGILTLETGFERVSEKGFKLTFQVVLFCDNSVTWTCPGFQRSIVLPWTGPQSAQAAQSYVEKAILKSLFKLPTGDPEPEGTGEDIPAPGATKPAGKAGKPAKPAPTPDASKAKLAKISNELAKWGDKPGQKMSSQDVQDFAEKWGADIEGLTEADKSTVRGLLKERREA